MESGGDVPSARIDQIGDGGILGTTFTVDGTSKDPGMTICDQALLTGFEGEDAAVGRGEEIHAAIVSRDGRQDCGWLGGSAVGVRTTTFGSSSVCSLALAPPAMP